ncbi:MAG: alpha-galactosidase [Anaerohalosphaeraceae bacterium]
MENIEIRLKDNIQNKIITDEGVDLYRQDFNIDPLGHWRANDTEDRQGITENKYVAGYLAYWDELLRRHPGMLIDSCASGGRRNDLETMRRAIPLYRSDYILEPVGNQGQTYGLSLWLPFYGAGYNLPVPLTEYCRRSKCHFRSAEFKLHDLDPKARYRIDNADTDQMMIKTGAELMEKGLVVEIPEQPGAVILKYAIVNTK